MKQVGSNRSEFLTVTVLKCARVSFDANEPPATTVVINLAPPCMVLEILMHATLESLKINAAEAFTTSRPMSNFTSHQLVVVSKIYIEL